ncbi:MAG: hypothetical protein AB2693_33160, partial [Candidatus Thiodiazotropha sp.]
ADTDADADVQVTIIAPKFPFDRFQKFCDNCISCFTPRQEVLTGMLFVRTSQMILTCCCSSLFFKFCQISFKLVRFKKNQKKSKNTCMR